MPTKYELEVYFAEKAAARRRLWGLHADDQDGGRTGRGQTLTP